MERHIFMKAFVVLYFKLLSYFWLLCILSLNVFVRLLFGHFDIFFNTSSLISSKILGHFQYFVWIFNGTNIYQNSCWKRTALTAVTFFWVPASNPHITVKLINKPMQTFEDSHIFQSHKTNSILLSAVTNTVFF